MAASSLSLPSNYLLNAMASLFFKDTKGANLSCASPAAAAVCSSIDRRSVFRPTVCRGAADVRRIRDPRSRARAPNPPISQSCSSSAAKPYNPKIRKSCRNQSADNSASPSCSSRFLLKDKSSSLVDMIIPEIDSSIAMVNPAHEIRNSDPEEGIKKKGETEGLMELSSSTGNQDQVVVLRVSLHCKGCEGKVRKHISKMEGVTSFEIDLASKKVTVIGNVTPLGVLNSVSKVKNAQFWRSPVPPPPVAASS
ncbi:Heavy metal-associated isoprenylated plant protein 26 [Apostasia shenzhenica]|uniref:Heavy metal-associated isoprenylated plant protein 26 n=1 Tax=Apostasia shenzhenica TaxID=1088818 RepID=A0A2H9ZZ38_9ASPA|nr:Heavy metal-associated isoprenylated plant protein 26 [Apostasia shenzhenica]